MNVWSKVKWSLVGVVLVLMLGCGGGKNQTAANPDSLKTTIDTSSIDYKLKQMNLRLQAAPNDYSLWLDRAMLHYESGNTPLALADVGKSLELNIANPEAFHFRGFLYYVQNQDSAALRDLQRAASLGSDNPETFYMIGQIFFFKKDYRQALDGYDNAEKLDSLSPTYPFAKGYMFQSQKKVDLAIDEYKRSLELDPGFIKALVALFDIYMNDKKNPDQAYVFNDRILTIDSLHPVGRFNQGNFFLNRANAITDPEKMVDFQVLLKLAISEFSKCLQKDPQYTLAYYNRGYSYYLLENYDRAMADFDQVIQRDPLNKQAFFMKASIQEFKGDLPSAVANYEQALQVDPKFNDAAIAVKELKAKIKK